MSALYTMKYAGQTNFGSGVGVLYIGRNAVVGVDITDNRYKGSYTEDSGRIRAEIALSVAAESSQLVAGMTLSKGQTLQILADLPLDFANGKAQVVHVAGIPVTVVFEEIGVIP